MQTKHPPLDVKLVGTRGKEVAKALQTDMMPIKSDRGGPVRELVSTDKGKHWAYVADMKRITSLQIRRLAISLAAKYAATPNVPDEWRDPVQMENTIRRYGFTVPIADCQLYTKPQARQENFLDRAQPKETP